MPLPLSLTFVCSSYKLLFSLTLMGLIAGLISDNSISTEASADSVLLVCSIALAIKLVNKRDN